MTCREVMTADPLCVVPWDTAARAAQIMKSEDVGPVLVVDDHSSRHLRGIVTDRDLALKVVAEGRDAGSVRVEEVMSEGLITCHPDADAHEAMRLMSDHQVRRIPVVDERDRLVGIIAQADVARHADEHIGDVVEDISQPRGMRSRIFGGSGGGHYDEHSHSGEMSGAVGSGVSSLAAALLGVGIGAGLMYLLDPTTGGRRRAVAKDRAMTTARGAAGAVGSRVRQIRGGSEQGGESQMTRSSADQGSDI